QTRPDQGTCHAPTEHVAVEPVFSYVGREFSHGLRVARLARVVIGVQELHTPEAEEPGAVRIALAVRERVVLAMHRNPLLSALPGRDPEDEAERDVGDRMHAQ